MKKHHLWLGPCGPPGRRTDSSEGGFLNPSQTRAAASASGPSPSPPTQLSGPCAATRPSVGHPPRTPKPWPDRPSLGRSAQAGFLGEDNPGGGEEGPARLGVALLSGPGSGLPDPPDSSSRPGPRPPEPLPALPRRRPALRLRAPRPPIPGSRAGGRTSLGWAAAPPRVAGTTAASPAWIQPKPSGRTPRPAEAPREAGKSRRRSETFVRSRGQDSCRGWRAPGLCRTISLFLDGCLECTTLARRGTQRDRICLSAQRREAGVFFCM